MLERLLDYGLQYTIYTLEVVLFVSLLRRGQWKRQLGVAVYVISLLTVDALVRPYFHSEAVRCRTFKHERFRACSRFFPLRRTL